MKITQSMLQQIEGWKTQKITKLILSQLEEMKDDYTKSVIGGSLLDNQVKQAQIIGKLEILNMILQPEQLIELIVKVDSYDDEDNNSVINNEDEGDYYGDSITGRDDRKIDRRDRS